MTEPLFDLHRSAYGSEWEITGADRAATAVAAVEVDEFWRRTALQAVKAMAASGDVFEAYDLVLRYALPEPPSSAMWGPLLAYAAAHERLIEPVGYTRSKRPSTNGALVRTWRGCDR